MRACFVFGGWMVGALAAVATMMPPRPARACGGCFHPPTPTQVTVVTGHRMAFSISPQQSVLWDQIEYSGSPTDFAWVLPVKAGAQIQLSHDEFFAALDALSNTVITGPTPNCGTGGGGPGFSCGASASNGGASSVAFSPSAGGAGGSGVQVLSQSVVGPYDTVTLRSTNPNALYDWLVANKYDIPASTRPIIDAYVNEKFDFIALRLAPGEGVQAMQPVRVVSPGAGLSLPLRMVSAGAGANVGITLYVISDGRYQAQNFPDGLVDASKLVWEHAQNQSNYEALAEQVMQGGGGRTWLTEFAQSTSTSGSAGDYASGGGYSCGSVGGAGSTGSSGGLTFFGSAQSLAQAYFAQCLCEGGGALCPQELFAQDAAGTQETGAGEAGEASTDAGSTDAASADATSSFDSGDDASAAQDGATSGGDSGGSGAPDGACGVSACDGFDDLSVASVGLDPSSTWVTRMRAILPAGALTAADLVLEAAPSQTAVSNQLTASVYDDPTYDPCAGGGGNGGGNGGGGCATTDASPWLDGPVVVVGGIALIGASLVRRRRALRRVDRRPRD